jgi:hypothetical protein
MGRHTLRFIAFGAVAASFVFGAAAEAAIPVAPLTTSSAAIVHVAGGCGPGRWRGPNGGCRGPGAGPGVAVGVGPVVVGVGPVYQWGVGRPGWRWDGRCWRGPAGGLHCR